MKKKLTSTIVTKPNFSDTFHIHENIKRDTLGVRKNGNWNFWYFNLLSHSLFNLFSSSKKFTRTGRCRSMTGRTVYFHAKNISLYAAEEMKL